MPRYRILSVDEGLASIRGHVERLGSEIVAIESSLGRITAEAAMAKLAVPSFRAAAMDGYAVYSGDIASASSDAPVSLRVAGRASPGVWPPPLEPGETFGIGTGAPVPEGADCVVMHEHVDLRDGHILISSSARPSLNVRGIGEDVVKGQIFASAGTLVTPDIIAGLAAYGVHELGVVRRPRLALIVTGNEITSGRNLSRAAIADSNGPMIRAYAGSVGLSVSTIGPIDDDLMALETAMDRAVDDGADVIMTTGGASCGEQDFVCEALERRGAEIIFNGLAMRPGKPLIFARMADGRAFFGLPGNPVAACVGMRFFVAQALRAALGLSDEIGVPVHSSELGREGVTVFLRGKMGRSPPMDVETQLDQRSHVLSSLIAADCWLRLDRREGACLHRMFRKDLAFDL